MEIPSSACVLLVYAMQLIEINVWLNVAKKAISILDLRKIKIIKEHIFIKVEHNKMVGYFSFWFLPN